MKEGKISSEQLKSLIFSKIKSFNKDILVKPSIGEDCAVIDYGDYACVLSTDPITGAQKGAGTLAVHISCNDIASNGVKPIALMITIMVPPNSTEEDIERIMQEACEAAAELEVDIIGGHTEVTSAVNRPIISTTAIGKILKEKLITSAGAKLGDYVVLTKWAGLEGTAIIAADKEDELKSWLSADEISEAKTFMKNISVVKEGVLSAEFGVNSMHDVTEGGVLGAMWEIAESANSGIEVYIEDISVHPITLKICQKYNISPYKLISSGCMVITTPRGKELVKHLTNNKIKASIIGKITDGERCIIQNNHRLVLAPPDVDDLFKISYALT